MSARRQDTSSSVYKPQGRDIPNKTRLFLYVQAGGRCEFDGCNEYLLEHYPTETVGNFAEMAHIYAFKENATRGRNEGRPDDIHALSNLILLCPACHKVVDVDRPEEYSVATLKRFKKDHEDRVFDLTGISKSRDTIPLILQGNVAGRAMEISDEEMQSAVAPRFIKRRDKVTIDLTAVPDDSSPAFWETAAKSIDARLDQLMRIPRREGHSLHVSVFAIAPIPLLVHAGARLSDKVATDLFQRHRVPAESWRWTEGDGTAKYLTRRIGKGKSDESVALLINLSGTNDQSSLPDIFREIPAYEITLDGQEPSLTFLNTRGDLDRLVAEYVKAMATIRNMHPNTKLIRLVPAVPAPVALAIGRHRLPKVDAPFLIFDRDKRAGGFVETLEVK